MNATDPPRDPSADPGADLELAVNPEDVCQLIQLARDFHTRRSERRIIFWIGRCRQTTWPRAWNCWATPASGRRARRNDHRPSLRHPAMASTGICA